MTSGRSSILTYHSLDTANSVISIAPQKFREQMACLAKQNVPVVPLTEVRNVAGAVALTFDDGFRNFFEHALPVLQKYNFPATVFAVSGYCAKQNSWPSQRSRPRVPTLDLMSWSELEQISKAGISVGSHTVTHPRMSGLPEAEIENELRASRAALEDRTGKTVDAFAYPYGDFTPAVRRAVERHFRLACTTKLAFVCRDSDPLELPRIDVYYVQSLLWFQALVTPYGAAYIAARNSLRRMREGWVGARA
jgi:peptidoglycan/xylan/chitin deacetylase (PgdA/CDA1 family)